MMSFVNDDTSNNSFDKAVVDINQPSKYPYRPSLYSTDQKFIIIDNIVTIKKKGIEK